MAGTWGTWLAGGVSVPLAVSHPPPELAYVIQDAGVSVVSARLHESPKSLYMARVNERHRRSSVVVYVRHVVSRVLSPILFICQ